ncbi:MAG: TonB-dependent receptor [Deltaproteobacteria bacterium]|nr:TonB-dependent receptor [Deltaproteobacteria bacterium]
MIRKMFSTVMGFAFVLTAIVGLSVGMVMAQEEKGQETASFKITEQSLENLKSESVPDDVLKKLQSLKNQEVIGEEKFLGILKETIGGEQTVRFKSLILKHAQKVQETAQPEPEKEKFLMEEISVTATRVEKSVFETPQAVNIVRREDLLMKNAANVGDALREEVGISLERQGSTYTGHPVIRGQSGNRTLALVDGNRFDNITTYGGPNHHRLGMVDMSQVERIEVIRGPGSTLYGSNAIGGVINFITRGIDFPEAGFSYHAKLLSQYSTVDNGFKERLQLHGATPKFGMLFGATWRKTDDIKTATQTLDFTALDRILDFDVKAAYRISASQKLELNYQKHDGDNIERKQTKKYKKRALSSITDYLAPELNRDYISLKYEAQNVTGFLDEIRAKAYYHDSRVDRWQNRFYYRADASTEREVDDRSLYENITTGLSIQSTSLIKDWQRLTYGFEFYVDDAARDNENYERLYDEKGTTITKKSQDLRTGFMDSTFLTASLFIQSEIDILDGLLTITPGVRFDRFTFENSHFDIDKSDQRFNGGVSVIYRMTDKLYWVGGIQQGYVHPGLNLVKEGPRTGAYVLPNPDLKPEDALQYEVGFRANYGKVSGFVTYYNNAIKNERSLKRTG